MYPYNYPKGEISMLNQNYTAKLLNLEDVIITNVENIFEEFHIYIELPRKKHTCPVCGSVTDRVHDYRENHRFRRPLHRGIQVRDHNRYRGIKRLLATELNQ